jgi:hypothetical protein
MAIDSLTDTHIHQLPPDPPGFPQLTQRAREFFGRCDLDISRLPRDDGNTLPDTQHGTRVIREIGPSRTREGSVDPLAGEGLRGLHRTEALAREVTAQGPVGPEFHGRIRDLHRGDRRPTASGRIENATNQGR